MYCRVPGLQSFLDRMQDQYGHTKTAKGGRGFQMGNTAQRKKARVQLPHQNQDSAQSSSSPLSPALLPHQDQDSAQPSSSPLSPALHITVRRLPEAQLQRVSGFVFLRAAAFCAAHSVFAVFAIFAPLPSCTFRFRFVFLSLKHAAFSALQNSMPTRTRMLHPRSPAVHLLCL